MNVRSADATRQAILRAALDLFAEQGFETVGVRAIGARANVDASLVNRYFGGKDELFIEVIKADQREWKRLWGEREHFPARLIGEMLHGAGGDVFLPSVLVMLRSSGSQKARQLVDMTLGSSVFAELEAWVDGPDADVRARLLMALIAGMAFARDLSGDFQLPTDRAGILAHQFSLTIEGLLQRPTHGLEPEA